MCASMVNFESLLAPLSGENPSGSDIRQDLTAQSNYRQAKQARTNARAIERQQAQGADPSTVKADWKKVYQLSSNILTTQSKDLEVITWLIEALLRLEGFAGLKDGFKFATQIIELYWDSVYPSRDEDGLTARIAPFTGLNGEDVEGSLIAPLALTPLIPNDVLIPITLWHYQQALALGKISEKQKQQLDEETITLDMIDNTIKETPVDLIQMQITHLESCIKNYTHLNEILIQKCGNEAPPSSRILNQLKACFECLITISQNILPSIETATPPITTPPLEEKKPAAALLEKASPPREQVLQNLLEAAQFFRATEPHSPLPYILERAVRWARMPLPDLLKELLHDEQTKKQLSHLTGIEFK